MATIQERIKELRTENGYTQEELAKLLGLNSKSNIANYENGANSPSDKIKIKMCKLFNCSMDYLMGLVSHKHPKEELEDELYKFNLSEEEYYDAINCFMYDSKTIQALALSLVFSPTLKDENLTRERKILTTILYYVFDFLPNDLYINNDKETVTNKEKREKAEKEFYKKFNKALIPAKKLLLSLDKNKIIHSVNKIDINDMDIAFATGIKGLNKENQEVLKNIMEGLLAKQEKDKKDKKENKD